MTTVRRALTLRSFINHEAALHRREWLLQHGPTREEYLSRLSREERLLLMGIGLVTVTRRKGRAA